MSKTSNRVLAVSKDLSGIRVIVTRPLAQGEPWAKELQQLGARTLLAPLLELQPVTDDQQRQAIKNQIMNFDLYQKAIFVSQNAVNFALSWLDDYWPQLPTGIEYFAVGETTARALQKYGLRVSALTATEAGAMNSETLLREPELQQVAGEKIIIFRGCGGRGYMGEILRERGAHVSYCELYQRHLPESAKAQFAMASDDQSQHEQQNPQVTLVALHSGESLQHYVEVLAQLANDVQASALVENEPVKKLQALPVLVPGARVADLARAAGFDKVIVAENATDKSMTAALGAYISISC